METKDSNIGTQPLRDFLLLEPASALAAGAEASGWDGGCFLVLVFLDRDPLGFLEAGAPLDLGVPPGLVLEVFASFAFRLGFFGLFGLVPSRPKSFARALHRSRQ